MELTRMTRRWSLLGTLVFAMGSTLAAGNRETQAMIPQMVGAWKAHDQIAPLSSTYGAFSMNQAYRIQQVLAREVTEVLGPVAGYKVAYASKAAQKQFGMTEPACGPFYMLQRVPSGSVLPVSAFNEIMLEPGMVISTGTAAPAYRVRGDEIKGTYVADCGVLGRVTMTIK